MKKLFTLVAMAFMAIGANAQEGAIVYEVDWTTQDAFYGDIWYPSGSTSGNAEVSVNATDGLVINVHQDAPETANYWEPQVQMIAHMASITEGGQYVVKFDVNAPAAGKVRLDFCSWDGSAATMEAFVDVVAGDNYFEVNFLDYPTECTDAMIFYQGAKIPGEHKIKKVEVWDLEAEGDATGIKTLKNKAQKNVRYNLAGQQVDANYKGAVIMNGKKFIQK